MTCGWGTDEITEFVASQGEDMASSYFLESCGEGSLEDDTLILVMDDNGGISVDQETLQSLILNQSDAPVSVVRLSQSDDLSRARITFTVDPPNGSSSKLGSDDRLSDSIVVTHPFLDLESDQVLRRETALQRENAEQGLGGNISVMLDMLSIEELQSSIRHSIELDHCYSNRSPEHESGTDLRAYIDTLPVEKSFHGYIESSEIGSSPYLSTLAEDGQNARASTGEGMENPPPRIVRQSCKISGHTQKTPSAAIGSSFYLTPNIHSQKNEYQTKLDRENVLKSSSSSESSESQISDSDSDFGPKPFRKKTRTRMKRTARCAKEVSLFGCRRRGSKKQVENEQIPRIHPKASTNNPSKSIGRKIDLNEERLSHTQTQSKISVRREEVNSCDSLSHIHDSFHGESRLVQADNKVETQDFHPETSKRDKKSIKMSYSNHRPDPITAQSRNVSRLDAESLLKKRHPKSSKGSDDISQNSMISTSVDLQATPEVDHNHGDQSNPQTPSSSHCVTSLKFLEDLEKNRSLLSEDISSSSWKTNQIHQTPLEIVSSNFKRNSTENRTEIGISEASKKLAKKECRKSDIYMKGSFGPALFSTPDIIRRVNAVSHVKPPADLDTPISSTLSSEELNSFEKMTPATDNIVTLSITSARNPLVDEFFAADSMSGKLTCNSIISPMDEKDTRCIKSHESDQKVSQMELPRRFDRARTKDSHVSYEKEIDGRICDESLESMTPLMEEPFDSSFLDVEKAEVVKQDYRPPVTQCSLPMSSTLLEPDSSELADSAESSIHQRHYSTLQQGAEGESRIPHQVIRGGRLITLPPIEAPRTRSKKLTSKSSNQRGSIVKTSILSPDQLQMRPFSDATQECKSKRIKKISSRASRKGRRESHDAEYNHGDDSLNSDSEDDPNRLWCICRQPHNNRFMICCDMCQDWFHGRCVQVTKAMGEQMESRGIEWVCPDCMKLKDELCRTKSIPKEQDFHISNLPDEVSQVPLAPNSLGTKSNNNPGMRSRKLLQSSGMTYCVVCGKGARENSIYCSDACILAHAETSALKDKPLQGPYSRILQSGNVPGSVTSRMGIEQDFSEQSTACHLQLAASLGGMQTDARTNTGEKSSNVNTKRVRRTITPNKQKSEQYQTSITDHELGGTEVPSSKEALVSDSKSTKSLNRRIQGELAAPPINLLKRSVESSVPSKRANFNESVMQIKHSICHQPSNSLKRNSEMSRTPNQKEMVQSNLKTSSVKKTRDFRFRIASHKRKFRQTECKEQKDQKEDPHQALASSKAGTDPVRLNVRKTLSDLLISRMRSATDIHSTVEEISELAVQIELEMFKFFKDTGAKYKAKYRSLLFNIKDSKNLTLFHKIVDRSLTPQAVVKLSPEEMASQELAEWRENETKHQLEMIKKNELDLMTQAKLIVVKTHKGEQIIENDGVVEQIDPESLCQGIAPVFDDNEAITSTVVENSEHGSLCIEEESKQHGKFCLTKEGSRLDEFHNRHKSERQRHKSRNGTKKSKKSSKHRNRPRKKEHKSKDYRNYDDDDSRKRKDRHKSHRNSSKSHHKNRSRDRDGIKLENEGSVDIRGFDETQEKFSNNPLSSQENVEDRLWKSTRDEMTTRLLDGDDSDISDREPSSTVIIKTPDLDEEIERERADRTLNANSTPSWQGYVHMAEVAKFFVTAHDLRGNAKDLLNLLPSTLDVVGRISPTTVWEYIQKMQKNFTKEIVIVELKAVNDEERIPYITLYSYLNSRDRLGVLGNVSPDIKDFYIMPFPDGNELPAILQPLCGPSTREAHQHSLLGIIVVNRSRKRQPSNISPTFLPTKLTKKGFLHEENNYQSLSCLSNTKIICSSAVLSKKQPQFSSDPTVDSLTEKRREGKNDDEPYSPGEPLHMIFEGDETQLPSSSLSGKEIVLEDSDDLQKRMDELSRQIEEEKKKIQNMSSCFRGDTTTLSGPKDSRTRDNDIRDPAVRRSFTPPPLSQPMLTKVSSITIPPNLPEILAYVKRQRNQGLDSYLPSERSATFLMNAEFPMHHERYEQLPMDSSQLNTDVIAEAEIQPIRNERDMLCKTSRFDLVKKAERELAPRFEVSALMDEPTLYSSTDVSTTISSPKNPGISP